MSTNTITKIPSMKPWIGKNYFTSKQKLLILGESHYLPKDSSIQMEENRWYSSTEDDLSHEEIEWISTTDIISYSIENNFNSRSHWIYKNIAQALNEILQKPAYSDALSYISFYNYFRRPAYGGYSLFVCQKDVDIAAAYILDFIKQNKPDIIIFTSSLAGEYGEEAVDSTGIPYFTVPDPTCQWWNAAAKKYGEKTGRELFIDFLNECSWGK